MAEQRVQRRLAAILAADVVGYSRMMREDEAGTLAQIKTLRRELLDPKVEEHGGRIVKTMGDGILIEFPSAVDAVQYAVDVQQALARRGSDVPVNRRVELRIGINLGDVIADEDDIFGDGVNIAARLESLCDAGAVLVSGVVHDQTEGKIAAEFEDLGEQWVKNVDKPVQTYRVLPAGSAGAKSVAEDVDKLLDRPAIAVLPFENMSGDSEQDYFADGLTEDIITALSLWRTFPVIARNSTFTFKGRSAKVQEVGRELGARYVVEGSVRRSGQRVRVTAQLIDAKTDHHVWAERYDRLEEDLFALQDELTQDIASRLVPEAELAARNKLVATTPKNLDAWEYCQRGMAYLYGAFSGDETALAREQFERAIEIDERYSRAYSGIAYSHMRDYWLQLSADRDESLKGLVQSARRAISLDSDDCFAHLVMIFAYMWTSDLENAIAEGEMAVKLNPNDAEGYAALGHVQAVHDNPADGIRNMERAIRLNPRAPRMQVWLTNLALSHLVNRNYESALECAKNSLRVDPNYPESNFVIASSLGHMGRLVEAREALNACHEADANFIGRWAAGRPYLNSHHVRHCLDGLRQAGWDG